MRYDHKVIEAGASSHIPELDVRWPIMTSSAYNAIMTSSAIITSSAMAPFRLLPCEENPHNMGSWAVTEILLVKMPGGGITQSHRLSPELSAIVGVKEVSFILIPSSFFDNLQFFLFSHFQFRSLNRFS